MDLQTSRNLIVLFNICTFRPLSFKRKKVTFELQETVCCVDFTMVCKCLETSFFPFPIFSPWGNSNNYFLCKTYPIVRFLRLLAEYDWTFSALVVDINNDFGPEDFKVIDVGFPIEN